MLPSAKSFLRVEFKSNPAVTRAGKPKISFRKGLGFHLSEDGSRTLCGIDCRLFKRLNGETLHDKGCCKHCAAWLDGSDPA